MDGVTTAMLLSRGLMDQPSPPFVFDLTKQLPPWQTFMLLVSKVYALLRVSGTNTACLHKYVFDTILNIILGALLPPRNISTLSK